MLPRPGSAASDPHPFPAGVVKLQDDVNSGLLPWPSEAAAALSARSAVPPSRPCCGPRQPLSPRGCSQGPGPTDGRLHPQKAGPDVCLINSNHSTSFAFTHSWGMEAPNSTTHQWLGLSSSHCWNPAPGLGARTAATAGRFPGTQLAALHEARGACFSRRGWHTARGGCLR